MSRNYKLYPDSQHLSFLTSAIVEWIPLFQSHRYFNILIDAFTYSRRNRGLLIHAYVLMPNHFHIIASSQPQSALPDIMRDFKRVTSRRLSRCMEEDGSNCILQAMERAAGVDRRSDCLIWQEGYHPKTIFTQKCFRQKLEYLHDNPVRKGYVRGGESWLYSSAWDYLTGASGMMEIDPLDI